MQCKYCGATLPNVDFPTIYKELREENGRLEVEHGEAIMHRNKMSLEINELGRQVSELKNDVKEERTSKYTAQILMVFGWVCVAVLLCASVGEFAW